MQQTQALAEPSSFANSEVGAGVVDSDLNTIKVQGWRVRLAVGALLGVSVCGYALALVAIDAVVKGNLPALF